MDALSGVRVIDLSTGIAGPYATKLFSDVGADVVTVELPGGDPSRRRAPAGVDLGGADSALFRFLHQGKRSVTGRAGDAAVEALVADADLVVESGGAGIDPGALLEGHPRLVVLSITPWGRRGPWAGRPATEFVVQAEAGVVAAHGRADEVPYQTGGRIIEWCAGVFGAVGALAAVRRAQQTGWGEHVDCSLLASATFASVAFVDARHAILGEPALTAPARIVDAPSIEPTKDGWVGVTTNTRAHFDAFLRMIERPDLLGDERWARADVRMSHHEEWDGFVHPWTTGHTTAEIVDRATGDRIPAVPVTDAAGVLEVEQFRAREVFTRSAGQDFVAPHPPYRFDSEPISVADRPAPRPGEHDGRIEARRRPEPTLSGAGPRRPLEGLRVLDATGFWAGPAAGQVLAFLGAEVIHLESVDRLDGSRAIVGPLAGAERWWERSAMWLSSNRDKQSLAVSLTHPDGRDLVARLLGTCDVLIENFAPRVFERFGFDEGQVQGLNPRIIYVRMPAFGLTGPWRDAPGFAQTMEQVTGMAWMTGHRHTGPRNPRGPCDPLAGYQAAFAVLVALARRDRTGLGGAVEAAMADAALNAAAELVINHTAYGVDGERDGNRSPDGAPQGVYRGRGEERWLALSVVRDEQWEALVDVIGSPAWADKPEMGTAGGRHDAHDLIDHELGLWASEQEVDEVVDALIDRGVPAGVVRDPRLMSHHPQLVALGYYEETDHPVCGPLRLPTIPFRYASIERWARRRAPLLGEHNHSILGGLLGVDEATLARLEAEGIIGTVPA